MSFSAAGLREGRRVVEEEEEEEDGGEGRGPLRSLLQGDTLRRETESRVEKVKGNEAVHELLPA